jgi:hypothetical protein
MTWDLTTTLCSGRLCFCFLFLYEFSFSPSWLCLFSLMLDCLSFCIFFVCFRGNKTVNSLPAVYSNPGARACNAFGGLAYDSGLLPSLFFFLLYLLILLSLFSSFSAQLPLAVRSVNFFSAQLAIICISLSLSFFSL